MLSEEKIKERVKKIRIEKGIKQSDFAALVGISQGAYSNFENGSTELSISKLNKIADALGVSVQYLLFGEEQQTKDDSEKDRKIKELERENLFLKKEISLLEKEISLLEKEMEVLEKEIELSELELEQVQNEINEVYSENENLKLKISNLLQAFNCIPRKIVNEVLNDKPELKNTLLEIFRKYNIDA